VNRNNVRLRFTIRLCDLCCNHKNCEIQKSGRCEWAIKSKTLVVVCVCVRVVRVVVVRGNNPSISHQTRSKLCLIFIVGEMLMMLMTNIGD
jgi:hypothetical protein